MSTRLIGGIIMTHGDEQGARFPPEVAPVQVRLRKQFCMWPQTATARAPASFRRLRLLRTRRGTRAQVVIVPVIPKAKDKEAVLAQCGAMRDALHAAGVRVRLDDSEGRTPGWKFSFWEMKGVPVRLEVGPRDVKKEACVVCRRDRPGKEGKEFGVPVEAGALVASVRTALDTVQVRRLHIHAISQCCAAHPPRAHPERATHQRACRLDWSGVTS